jgi:CheY-like chemotaxis protein
MSESAPQILLVGGDPQWAGTLSSNLGDGRRRAPSSARNAEEALQLLHQHPVDLVLADLDSPAGRELLRQL